MKMRARLKRTLPCVCELCGEMIEIGDSWDVDHIEPIRERPDLAFDAANVRATHALCNRRRGAGLSPRNNLCLAGHELTAENTKLDCRGRRRCRECANARERERKARRRAEWLAERRLVPRPPDVPLLIARGNCVHGHVITGYSEIRLLMRNGRASWVCRRCQYEAGKRWRERQRAEHSDR